MTSVVVSGSTAGLAPRRVRDAVEQVLRGEGRGAAVAVTFVGKRAMQQLNTQYLQHDYPTDVLAFPLPHRDGSVAGDIYICRYMAARNARRHRSTVRTELLRLAVHGTLHVLGWDHPAGAGRTGSPMWRRQERYVGALT
jgi:probable rRNA maturation factor